MVKIILFNPIIVLTAIVGLDNIVVVNTEDATLVIPKDRVEDVKDISMLKLIN